MLNKTKFKKIYRSKKAGLNLSLEMIITIILAIIIGLLVLNYFRNSANGAGSFFDKFTKSNTQQSNDFLFDAESISIAADNKGRCAKNGEVYGCEPGNVHFEAIIKNQGSETMNMRSFSGGIAVCRAECDKDGTNCKVKSTDSCLTAIGARSSDHTSLKNGESLKLDAGTVYLDDGFTYQIYPVAICKLDMKIGCWKEGLVDDPFFVNKNNYVTIKVSPQKQTTW